MQDTQHPLKSWKQPRKPTSATSSLSCGVSSAMLTAENEFNSINYKSKNANGKLASAADIKNPWKWNLNPNPKNPKKKIKLQIKKKEENQKKKNP